MKKAFSNTCLFLLLLVSSCSEINKGENYRFFYSGYSWHLSEAHRDTFYLAFYFEINNKGEYRAMKHNEFMDMPVYATGKLDGEITALIQSVFSHKYHPTYFSASESFNEDVVRSFYFKTPGLDGDFIQFKPEYLPNELKSLNEKLDGVIANSNFGEEDTFDLIEYVKLVESFAMKQLPLPPKPQNILIDSL